MQTSAERIYSQEEKDYLKNVADLTLPEILDGINSMSQTKRTGGAITAMMGKNNWLYRKRINIRRWDDPEEERFIIKNIASMTRQNMAIELKRPVSSITGRIQKLRKEGRLPARVSKIKTFALQDVVVQVTKWLVVDGNATNVEFLKREKARLSRSVVRKDAKGRKALFRTLTIAE